MWPWRSAAGEESRKWDSFLLCALVLCTCFMRPFMEYITTNKCLCQVFYEHVFVIAICTLCISKFSEFLPLRGGRTPCVKVYPRASRISCPCGAGALRASRYTQGHPAFLAPAGRAHSVRQGIQKAMSRGDIAI